MAALKTLMRWTVLFHQAFHPEFEALTSPVKQELLALLDQLSERGPQLDRPQADTLDGSKYANMKELRFFADDGVWRVAFAFDPARAGILLVAGDKSGVSQSRFYKSLIRIADKRFAEYLRSLENERIR